MTKQWKKSLEQTDIVSDGTAFQGSHIDAPISEAGASTEVKNHDLRFIREISRLFFDRSMDDLNFTEGIFDVFVDGSKLTLGDPAPRTEYGSNGYLWFGGLWGVKGSTFSQSINTQDSTPRGLTWKSDGTKLYEIGADAGAIYEYNVSTAWDVSTATFSQSINTQGGEPTAVEWGSNGYKLYESDRVDGKIYEYDVSTAWDISTATFSQSINSQDNSIFGLAWKSDGTKLYESGGASNNIYEYDVSTAWDISTATFSQSINSQADPHGITWKPDGTKLYEITAGNEIYEYDVGTAWDISTATFSQSTTTQDNSPTGFSWNSNGDKFYYVGNGSNNIYEHYIDVSSVPSYVSWSKSLNFTPTTTIISHTTEGEMTVDYTITDSSGNSVTITDSEVGTEYDVSALADGDLTIEAELDSPDAMGDDKQRDFAVYFD